MFHLAGTVLNNKRLEQVYLYLFQNITLNGFNYCTLFLNKYKCIYLYMCMCIL